MQWEEAEYYQTLMDYIHRNPVRAGLVQPGKGESVLDFASNSKEEVSDLAESIAGLGGQGEERE